MRFLFLFFLTQTLSGACEGPFEVTPYKFLNSPPSYKIPASARFTCERLQKGAPPIVYYFSPPSQAPYPIVIFCSGSETLRDRYSIIHVHRYFLKEFRELNLGVVSVERWGVDGEQVDTTAWVENYTRSQRLCDHKRIVEHLKSLPPKGWDGTFIFFGVSEGGPLVNHLSTEYQKDLRATINWSGAGDWSWREELWTFYVDLKKKAPFWQKMLNRIPFIYGLPQNRKDFDTCMNATYSEKTDNFFLDMSYKYHTDAMTFPHIEYEKIKKPFLVVAGTKDSLISSSDAFVEKALKAGAPLTYMRVEGMDHYVRHHPKSVKESFDWLKTILEKANK